MVAEWPAFRHKLCPICNRSQAQFACGPGPAAAPLSGRQPSAAAGSQGGNGQRNVDPGGDAN